MKFPGTINKRTENSGTVYFFAENKESHEEILHYLHNPWNVFKLTSAVETAIF